MPSPLARLLSRISPDEPTPHALPGGGGLALVLPGGGARAAYQAGVVRALARLFPEERPRILTGVSAGALNASFLAANARDPYAEAADALVELWRSIRSEHVFHVDRPTLAATLGRVVRRTNEVEPPAQGGILDTTPLHAFAERTLGPIGAAIPGISEAIEARALRALAITTTSYTTGQSITWVQGRDVDEWDRPTRRALRTDIRAEHVLASAALPFFFPAVAIDDPGIGRGWYGDGGIRLTAPLSPALHLGADRLLVITTRYARTADEAARHEIEAYPPLAQIMGVLMNAVFLDVIDRDAQTVRRINEIIEAIPKKKRNGFRPVGLKVIRPSEDIGMMASGHEPQLPPAMRFLMRGVGTDETKSPDWLSMLLFEPSYVEHLIGLGEADVEAQRDEIGAFLGRDPVVSG